jgi:hypothetical protein
VSWKWTHLCGGTQELTVAAFGFEQEGVEEVLQDIIQKTVDGCLRVM